MSSLALLVASPAWAEPVTAFTVAAQNQAAASMPSADQRDVDFAHRGFLGTLSDPIIKTPSGAVAWDLSAYDFLKAPAPATANPSLWRHAQLMALNGLFQVSDHIWQVRGFDLANTTFVKGKTGWIVIDTLASVETARAAKALVDQKLGKQPIVAVIFTHPHADHFGGVGGMISADDVKVGRVQVIAPKGFLAAAVGENVIAGAAMQRRGYYQFGRSLPKGPAEQINTGIGAGISTGTNSLIAPTKEISATGETLVVDGVKMEFQYTVGTEAPVEMNIYFPDWNVIDMAENANATQHNVLTPRGAIARDAKAWADGLSESIERYGNSDILIASHGWPRLGQPYIRDYLGKQSDYYAFVHDQTVRLMNEGLTGDEIASRLVLPPSLAKEWYDRPYYGSVSFNSRAVYQYYMGWYDANPVHLATLPRSESAQRYVEAMGGREKVFGLATAAFEKGDYAWAAVLLDHLVFSEPSDTRAKTQLARSYDQLAYQTENSLWRNMYLTASLELTKGAPPATPRPISNLSSAMTSNQIFDLAAVQLDGTRAADVDLKIEFVFPERNELTFVSIKNGVLHHRQGPAEGRVDARVRVDRAALLPVLFADSTVEASKARIDGDPSALKRLAELITHPMSNFPIVTPAVAN